MAAGRDPAILIGGVSRNLASNYGREYKLGRWSGKAAVVRPAARKRARKASG